jgi:D-amino peptidase
MKAFVSVDMEGMPYIVIPGHLNLKGALYEEARKIATKITLITADELHKNGFEKVVIADSHGPMVNIQVDDLPEYVEIVRGFYRPLSMIAGAEDCDAAVFLGYHAKYGTAKSTFDHTYSGASINKLEINGTAMSEFLLNASTLGDFKIPVILVAGEAQLLEDDVKQHAPKAQRVALKHSLSRLSARSPALPALEKELRSATKKACASFQKKAFEPLTIKKPIKMKITFIGSHFADAAQLLPGTKRLDGLSVECTCVSMTEAYRTFELLVLASSGVSSILENLR